MGQQAEPGDRRPSARVVAHGCDAARREPLAARRSAATAWRRHGAIPDQAELSADNVALVAALRQLPEAQRVAIVLHYLYDLPVAQVAEETASSVGAVKTRLSRARTALAFLLNPTADPEDSRV